MAKYKISPNEIDRLLQEERNRRRRERLIQVRDQANIRAASVRKAVKSEKYHQMDILAQKTEGLLNEEKCEKVSALEEELLSKLNTIGHGHREANEQEPRFEHNSAVEKENKKRAKQRHAIAIQWLKDEVGQKDMEKNRQKIARQSALEVERERAAKVAAMPPPVANPINEIGPFQIKPVQLTDGSVYTSTYYHIPDQVYVEKNEILAQSDARDAAMEESERIEEKAQELMREKQEQREKARVRHKNAREKEIIRQDYAQMLHDMSDLQRQNQKKRKNAVAQIPKQIFIPPSIHILEKQQQQKKVAQAFEDMYMAATDQMGDISVALSNPQPYEY